MDGFCRPEAGVSRGASNAGTVVAQAMTMVLATAAWHRGSAKCVIAIGGCPSDPVYSVRIVKNRTILRSQLARSAGQAFEVADSWRAERVDRFDIAAPAA